MPGAAAYGYDELARQKFYGFRAHVRISWPGVITGVELTPANVHDLTAAEHLAPGCQGYLLADRNYWSPRLTTELAAKGVHLLAPSSKIM